MTLFFAQAIVAALIIWVVILIQKRTKNALITTALIVGGFTSGYVQFKIFKEFQQVIAAYRSPAVICTCDKPMPGSPEALIHQPNKSLWMNDSN